MIIKCFQPLLMLRETVLVGLTLLMISCFAEKLEQLPFFSAATDKFELEGLGDVRLFGKIEDADQRFLEIGFLLSSVNPDPHFTDSDVDIISANRPSLAADFEFDQLVTGLDEVSSTYYYRAFARNEQREIVGAVRTFTFGFDFRMAQVFPENIDNDTVSLKGIIFGLENLRESVADHGFVLGFDPSQLFPGSAIAKKHLGQLNDDGSFLGDIAQLTFNTDYLARAFIITDEGNTLYSNNITDFRVEDGWLSSSISILDEPFTGGIALTIGSNIYLGLGCVKRCYEGSFIRQLWKFDPSTGTLQAMSRFPAIGRAKGVAFVANDKIYFGLGCNRVNNRDKYFDDFWEFDPVMNSWRQVKSFPAGGRDAAIAFSIDDQGYVGTGRDSNLILHSDFYQFYPPESPLDSGRWERLDDQLPVLPQAGAPPLASGRYDAVAFTIGDYAYVGTGRYLDQYYKDANDFWKFDPAAQTWAPVAFLGEEAQKRHDAIAFALGGKGYVGLGIQSGEFDKVLFNDLWELSPNSGNQGQWIQRTDFQGKRRRSAVGFAMETRKEGYVAGGEFFSGNETEKTVFDDLWTYIPAEQ